MRSNSTNAQERIAPMKQLPAEFDPEFYRRCYPDMRRLSDADAASHFWTLGGANEGRQGSPAASRATFFGLLDAGTSILEIGPFANPITRGPNVKYFDVLPTEELKRRAIAHGLNPRKCPQIDFVSATGDLAAVTDGFNAVVSSHAIEHQPDLVRHLEGVGRILNPAGRYFLAVPDKRFCFDHFIAESTIADVLDAHVRGIHLHDAASVIQHRALTTHNDPSRHWNGDHGGPAYKSSPGVIREALNTCLNSSGMYIDTHAWQFTPSSFRDIMRILFDLKLSPFRLARVYETVRDSNEFFAVLEKESDSVMLLPSPVSVELPGGFDEALYLLANPDVAKAGVNASQHYLSYGYREGRKLRP
jgi:SAM-dependent methyltransferase